MQLNITTADGAFITIHDELKGDTEAKATIRYSGEAVAHLVDCDLAWFSDITEGETFTMVFALNPLGGQYSHMAFCESLNVSSGSADPRHTCNGTEDKRFCRGCDTVVHSGPITARR